MSRWRNRRRSGPRSLSIKPFKKNRCVSRFPLSTIIPDQSPFPLFQSIIVRAQGEARAAELIGEALRSNKGFLQLRRLEAARDIANLLSTSGNRLMLDSQSLLLNG